MKKRHLLFLISLLPLGPALPQIHSESPHTPSGRVQIPHRVLPIIEKIYRDHAQAHHLPGLVFGVVLDSALVCSGGIGYADLSLKTPATPQSLFRIASMTKSITAMAILLLRDQGRLSLDDPAEWYIPEMKNLEYPAPDAPRITIRHLLTHTAGFPEDNPWGDRQLAVSDQQLLDMVKNGISFSNAPGVAYEYSNLGFALLGRIIAVVSGKSYQEFVQTQILQPLAMNHSIWEYSQAPRDLLAWGYSWEGGRWIPISLLPDGAYAAMGGLITSMDDFSKYMIYHLSAWPPGANQRNSPVSAASLREMQRPWVFNNLNASFRYPNGRLSPLASCYGYGLRWIKDGEGRISLNHGGGLPGFGSQWRILPEYGIGVAAFSNRTYADLGAANDAVLDTCIALLGLSKRPTPVTAILQQRRDELTALLPDWQVTDPNLFGDNFFLDQSIDSLRRTFQSLYAELGPVVGIREMVALNRLRGSFIVDGQKADLELFFTLTPQNPPRIQQLKWKIIR
ncbi:MAG TPA: serine hydrolase domain-containing protein [bacterium]|nr:serine hydrolase domain-containing protein [bacterium]